MSGVALNHSLEREELQSSKSSNVSLIRQELVTLVRNHSRAVILNQLLYWTQRTKDFSSLIEEERNKSVQETIPQYGWIYKTAEELQEETLLQVDRTTIRRYLTSLIKEGWLFERSHPQNKWDRTTQYRVNVRKIHEEFQKFGLSLSDISLWRLEDIFGKEEHNEKRKTTPANVYILHSKEQQVPSKAAETSSMQNAHSSEQNSLSNGQNLLKPAETSSGHNARSNGQNARSSGQFARCNTETTTEITNKEHTTRARDFAQNDFDHNDLFEKGLGIWKACIGQDVHLTEKRKLQLSFALERHFQNDLSQWETFCERIKASPFLMGEGSRRWRVSLDWILVEENLLKILEGNFDDSIAQEHQESKQLQNEKAKEILESIVDPQWKEWCTQWAQGIWLNANQVVIEPLSCSDLERIANARFLEIEDDRLVWVGSTDSAVLNKIESLRLPLYSIISRTFPNSRTLRTRLIETPQTNHSQQTTQEKKSC